MDSSAFFHTDKIKEAQSDFALFERRAERDNGAAHNKLIIKSVENFTDIKVIAACLLEIDEKTYTKDVCVFDTKNIYETIKLHVLIRYNK